MKYINAVTLLFICSISFSQGINFVPEDMKWQDVLAKAKKENKIVFVDAYTTWCGPCKWMAANIFPTKEVGDVFNASFVNAKIDMEKGEGIICKYCFRHLFTRPAPGSIGINKDEFVFFYSFLFNFFKRSVFKCYTFILR